MQMPIFKTVLMTSLYVTFCLFTCLAILLLHTEKVDILF